MKQSATQVVFRGKRIDIHDASEDTPLEVIVQAKAAFRQRIQDQVAALVWDSLLDDGAPSWHHHLRFEHPRMWIEVSVSVEPARANLHGVMHPAIVHRVELQFPGTDAPVRAEVTRSAFRIDRFRRGQVRLCFRGPEGVPVVYTDWFYV
jgi:hypothetical protein